MIKEDYIITIN
jgi:hypothetical protein